MQLQHPMKSATARYGVIILGSNTRTGCSETKYERDGERERTKENRKGGGRGGRNDWLIGCGAERVSHRDSEKRKKGINI